jgi:hypothetical protein
MQARKGATSFINFLTANYEPDAVRSIALQVYDEVEVDAILESMKELVPMFTYGILKYPANIANDGGVNIVEMSKVKGHVIYATGKGTGFPVTKVTGNESNIVFGTYFEIPRHVVEHSYDITEGYHPNNPAENNMYNRTLVDVILPNGEVKQANMYIANADWFTESMLPEFEITTGNYDDKSWAIRFIKEQWEQ